jgi:hypothetical protein
MLELNIYQRKELKKTYTAEGYFLTVGTMEDVLGVLDFDKMEDEKEVAKMIVKACTRLQPIVFDIFPDLTDEDYRLIRISDLVPLFVQVCKDIIGAVKSVPRKN